MLTIINFFVCVCVNNIDRNSHTFLQVGVLVAFGGEKNKMAVFVLSPLSGTGASSRPFFSGRGRRSGNKSQRRTLLNNVKGQTQHQITAFCTFSTRHN